MPLLQTASPAPVQDGEEEPFAPPKGTIKPPRKDLSKPAFTPEQITIDPETDTVAGRISKITTSGSPLMQLSDTQVKQAQNVTGTLNTSMTAGAIEKARLGFALPIAQSDAASSLATKGLNVAAINRAREIQATGGQALEQIGAGGAEQRSIVELANAGDIDSIQARGAQDRQNILAGTLSRSELIGRQGEIDEALLTASGDVQQELQQQRFELDRALVDQAQEDRVELLDNQAEINLQFEEQRADLQIKINAAEGDEREQLLRQQGLIDLANVRANGAVAKQLQADKAEIDARLTDLQAGYTTANIAQQGQLETDLLAQRAEIETSLQGMIGSQALEQQGLRGEQAVTLQNLENANQRLLQTSASAATLYSNVSQAMSEILANPDIPASAKNGLIAKQTELLKAGLAVIGGIGEIDLSEFLTFTTDSDDDRPPGWPPDVPWPPRFNPRFNAYL